MLLEKLIQHYRLTLLAHIKTVRSYRALSETIPPPIIPQPPLEPIPIISARFSNLAALIIAKPLIMRPPLRSQPSPVPYRKTSDGPSLRRDRTTDVLLFNRLDAFPTPAQPFLPQTNPVVARANRKRIAAETPAHAPRRSVDIDLRALPLAQVRGSPDRDGFVLRRGSDVGFGEDGGGPCYVADPVAVDTTGSC